LLRKWIRVPRSGIVVTIIAIINIEYVRSVLAQVSLCLASAHPLANAMWAKTEVADQVRKLACGGRALDPAVQQCADATDLGAVAKCLMELPDNGDGSLDGLRRSLRDFFVAGCVGREGLERAMEEHFRDVDAKLRSQLCLAYHHVHFGKFAKGSRSRAPRRRTVTLLLRTVGGGAPHATFAVERNASLRECQQELCKLFKNTFPKYKASLVFTGVRVFHDFMDRPFRRCAPTDEAVVVFTETDDPYFYDVFDRCGKMPLPGSEEEHCMPLLDI